MPIQILSPQVANQIAAGEVVERPASVVKELIENSLDASASDIRVEVREGGRRLVRVQDNGCGIPAAEARLAFERHATSKIVSLDDLDHLATLGFRGEALASIAAVAQVTLLTRASSEEIGTLIRMAEGREATREPAGSPPGTVVTVEHLFGNLPARLKFLKQAATEAGHIQQIVTRYALAYPESRFSLVNDGKLTFQSTGSGKLYDVLVKVYGLDMARQMLAIGDLPSAIGDETSAIGDETSAISNQPLAISHQPSTIQVSGYVGMPALHRGNRNYITLFVNRRWFQDAAVAYGVIQAYHTLLPTGRYPVALVFIEIDPADVDVNVHPTKAEVRFRDNRAVFSAVQRAVRKTLVEHAPIPTIYPGFNANMPQPESTAMGQMLVPHWAHPEAWSARREALLGAGRELEKSVFAPELPVGPEGATAGGPIPGASPPVTPGSGMPAVPELRSQPQIPLLRVIGQLNATYIVAEGPDGMYLVDQHAAHERILYEQMLVQHAEHKLAVQSLLEPLILDLSPEQAAVVAEELDTLGALGVAIEPFGGVSYLVRAIPAILSGEEPQSALIEIIDGLMQNADVTDSAREAVLITVICKRAAIKGGQALSAPEMQEMVRRLELCRAPRTCPHGRPTMIYLSADALARQFGRV